MCSLRYSICTGTRCSQVLGVHRVKRVNYPYILGHFADYAPHKTLYMHLVYSCALNEQGTQLTPQSSIDPYLPCSAAVKFHNITYTPCNIPYRPSTPKSLHTGKTDHMCHAQYSNYIVHCHPQYNSLTMHINLHYTPSNTHHTAFHNPPLHTTNKHKAYWSKWWQNGTRCRDGVKVLWCHSHLVQLVFEDSIPTCTCFHFCDLLTYSPPGDKVQNVCTNKMGSSLFAYISLHTIHTI